jgi:hypothetical protein
MDWRLAELMSRIATLSLGTHLPTKEELAEKGNWQRQLAKLAKMKLTIKTPEKIIIEDILMLSTSGVGLCLEYFAYLSDPAGIFSSEHKLLVEIRS